MSSKGKGNAGSAKGKKAKSGAESKTEDALQAVVSPVAMLFAPREETDIAIQGARRLVSRPIPTVQRREAKSMFTTDPERK